MTIMYNIRHDHIYTSIREEMKSSPMGYCKTIHEMSIADIISLINYSEKCNERFLSEKSWDDNILELKIYIEEFNGRLSNRTVNFNLEETREKLKQGKLKF